MLSKPDKFDIEDYPKRYSGTWVQIQNKETKEKQVGYIYKIAASTKIWEGYFTTGKEDKQNIISSSLYEIIEGFPTIGVVNCDKDVVITSRQPNRQWKRGICPENFKIVTPLYSVINKTAELPVQEWPFERYEISTTTLTNIYNNEYFSIKEALDRVTSLERFGAAVNNVFWFSPSWYSTSVILWYKEVVVGEYKNDKLIILEKAFEQEIKDFFKDSLCLL
jgi:hypothetical protein